MTRLKQLQQLLATKRLPMVITQATNLKYLVGFLGLPGDGCLVVGGDKAVLITDARYQQALQEASPLEFSVIITRKYFQVAGRLLERWGDSRVGFEASLAYGSYQKLAASFSGDLVAVSGIIEKMRQTKEPEEIKRLARAGRLASAGFLALVDWVRVGQREKEVSDRLANWMQTHGAQGPSFSPLVVSGKRSALPHGQPSQKKLAAGEVVTVDFGFYVDGYTADLTRTFALGDPGRRLKKAYQVVLGAQNKMRAALYPGNSGFAIDAAGRNYIKGQGFGKYFNHGAGHGIGLSIHEGPNFSPQSQYKTELLPTHAVVTAEPGIYLPGLGGIRIEDDFLINLKGAQFLTTAPRKLLVL